MKSNKINAQVLITLTNDEAIVLFEWLQSFNEKEKSVFFNDQAEERILFDLEAELEKNIADTFRNNYQEILAKARQRVRDID